MLTLYALQTLAPLLCVAWIAIWPPRNLLGFWTMAIGTGVGIIALGYAGLWLFPAWWTPHVLGALLMTAVATSLLRRKRATIWPAGILGWVVAAGFATLGLVAANTTRQALSEAAMPDGPSMHLASPLGPGRYLVANGGAGTTRNAHADALDQSIPAHRAWRGTAYGVDLVAIGGWGSRADGVMPANPERYRIFGMPVLAPCAGEVVVAVDGLPDMQVPEQDDRHLAGNHIILRCAGADIVLGHFRRGSLSVRVGTRVEPGAVIGEVGNSGASSEPHLHIHAQAPGTSEAPFSGAPIPIRIAGRFLLRNTRLDVP